MRGPNHLVRSKRTITDLGSGKGALQQHRALKTMHVKKMKDLRDGEEGFELLDIILELMPGIMIKHYSPDLRIRSQRHHMCWLARVTAL